MLSLCLGMFRYQLLEGKVVGDLLVERPGIGLPEHYDGVHLLILLLVESGTATTTLWSGRALRCQTAWS